MTIKELYYFAINHSLLDEEVEVSSGGTTNVAMFNGNKRTTNKSF